LASSPADDARITFAGAFDEYLFQATDPRFMLKER
jgi:hypothetical protein